MSDRKLLTQANTSATAIAANDYFSPDVVTHYDYYPGGSLMPGRNGNSNEYRYGFNKGSEKDD